MRSTIFLLLLAISIRMHGQGTLYSEKIKWRYQSCALSAENLKQIKSVWEHLPLNAEVELLMVSKKEVRKLSPEKLTTLSKSRSDAIRLFLLTQKMVSPYDIEYNSHRFTEIEAIYGSSAFFKRRVKDPYKVHSLILSKEVPICYNLTDAERRALDSKAPSVFHVTNDQDYMMKGPGGVIVLLPSYSFNLPPEKKTADITIKLWEFLKTDEMILAGLSTTSGSRLLETGGMIYITAECEGNCLRLLRSSKLIIKFPVYERLDSMRLFKGVPYAKGIDWKKTRNFDNKNPYPIKPEVTNASPEEEQGMEGEGDSANINYYVLESSGLGWINCDRFSEVEEKIDVAYTCLGNFVGMAGLVFTDINSIMSGELVSTKTNNLRFYNVPKGKEAVLLVYSVSKDRKKVFYSQQKIILGDKPAEEIKLKEASIDEFKSILKWLK